VSQDVCNKQHYCCHSQSLPGTNPGTSTVIQVDCLYDVRPVFFDAIATKMLLVFVFICVWMQTPA